MWRGEGKREEWGSFTPLRYRGFRMLRGPVDEIFRALGTETANTVAASDAIV